MPRILKNIRIDEVSACTKGAGVGTRIVLMKRDDSADDFDEWHREQARIAEEQNELHLRKHARNWRSFNEVLAENTAKSFAAVARGDEADRRDEETPADELVDGGNDHHASKVADLLVESGKHPDRQTALDHLLHTASGQALLRRMHKQHEDTTMSATPSLSDIVKAHSIIAVAKAIVDDGKTYSITEHEFTEMLTEQAKREYPELSPAQAFEKLFTAPTAVGEMLRQAHSITKTAGAAPYFDLKPMFVGGEDARDVDDPAKAIAQLKELGRQKWPTESEAEQFARAFTDPANAKLAAKAHRRPSATTLYPFPK
jgi:hypothetical protein